MSNLVKKLVAGQIRYIAAPMVCQSDLPYRMLLRKHGCSLAYTPMIHADRFLKDPSCRTYYFQTAQADRPLVAQFCGNDAQTILAAAKLVQDKCDAIDLNLGCPQASRFALLLYEIEHGVGTYM